MKDFKICRFDGGDDDDYDHHQKTWKLFFLLRTMMVKKLQNANLNKSTSFELKGVLQW